MDNHVPYSDCSWYIYLCKGLLEGLEAGAVKPIPEIAAQYSCKTLTELAAQYCGIHERSFSYLETAPILLTTATHFPRALSRGNVAVTRSRCERGARARDVMEAERLSWPLRKISAFSIPANTPALTKKTLLLLSIYVGNSTLSQSISENASNQRLWLKSLAAFVARIDRRTVAQGFSVQKAINWACFSFSRADDEPSEDLADFIISAPREFNYEWTYGQAVRAMERWHETIDPESKQSEAFQRRFGVSIDEDVPLGMYPRSETIGGYTFDALLNGKDLLIEGRVMRHCVGTYFPDVRAGVSRIYSIKKNGDRLATLEINPSGVVQQLKGKRNAPVDAEVRKVASEFASSIRQEIAMSIST